MRCLRPYVSMSGAFGCGRCLPCLVKRRRMWTGRILLEALCHAETSFVTLTYSDKELPADGGLVPEHLRDWLKRFRFAVQPRKLRYFAVGEYSDTTWRPHYHLALFGWPPCTLVERKKGKSCPCSSCSLVRSTWKLGHVSVDRLEQASAAYIAGYVTKKMTRTDDPRLRGRWPEFARMSLGTRGEGGIGAIALHDVASEIMRRRLDDRDVPGQAKHGKAAYPLGPYLTKRFRRMIGRDEQAPENVRQKAANQLSFLRAYALATDRPLREVFLELNQPYADQIAARQVKRGSI